jgi:hypothetical protein
MPAKATFRHARYARFQGLQISAHGMLAGIRGHAHFSACIPRGKKKNRK